MTMMTMTVIGSQYKNIWKYGSGFASIAQCLILIMTSIVMYVTFDGVLLDIQLFQHCFFCIAAYSSFISIFYIWLIFFYLSFFCNSYLVWIFSPIYNLQICGEHKESGILRHGFFASSISQEADLREEELELVQRSKGGLLAGLFQRFSCATIVAIKKL